MTDEPRELPSLTGRAESDLRFIRSIMQRTSHFIPLPGWGIITVGLIGLLTAFAARQLSGLPWVAAWCAAAGFALLVALITSSWQLRKNGKSILVGKHRDFWLSLWPAFAAAIPVTAALLLNDQTQLLSGCWLLLFGVGVLAASRHTVPEIGWLGYGFLLLGVPALFLPWPNVFMGLGFGGLHLLVGFWITRSDSAQRTL